MEIQKGDEKASYGDEVLEKLSQKLTEEFGKKSNAFIREYHQEDSLSCVGG